MSDITQFMKEESRGLREALDSLKSGRRLYIAENAAKLALQQLKEAIREFEAGFPGTTVEAPEGLAIVMDFERDMVTGKRQWAQYARTGTAGMSILRKGFAEFPLENGLVPISRIVLEDCSLWSVMKQRQEDPERRGELIQVAFEVDEYDLVMFKVIKDQT